MWKFAGLLTTLFFSAPVLSAQNIAAMASLDKNAIQVGDPANLLLEVTQTKKGAQVSWPKMPAKFGALEVLEQKPIDTITTKGRISYRQQISVTGFDSGKFTIPPFRFDIVPEAGRGAAYTLITDSLSISVQTVAIDKDAPIKPDKDIMEPARSWRDFIWYIVAAFASLLLGFLLFYYLKRKKKAANLPAPPENLSDKTLRLLRALEQKKIWQEGEDGIKAYYVSLTEILRSYIEARFGIKALELTTDEFLEKIKNHPELKSWSSPLFSMLHTADMAKFARSQPHEIRHEQAMQTAKELVRQSRPVIVDASSNKT